MYQAREPFPYFFGWEFQTAAWVMFPVLQRKFQLSRQGVSEGTDYMRTVKLRGLGGLFP